MNMKDTFLRTARKHNINLAEVTQNMEAFKKCSYSNPRLRHRLLRRYLSDFGFRGAALNAEVKRIVAGPEKHLVHEGSIWNSYPYGWDERQFTRAMKRIFKGRGKRTMLMMDELHLYWNAK